MQNRQKTFFKVLERQKLQNQTISELYTDDNESNREKISNEQFNLCKAKISFDGIIESINSQTNESPGNDNLMAEFYKHFIKL